MPVVDKESQKKMIGELLKNADKHIKNADWTKALEDVGKALAIEPNNMYAMAYKDRINASIAADKKKADEEKVKKLAEEKKAAEKPAEPPKEEKKAEEAKPAEPPKTEPVPEEKKPEPGKPAEPVKAPEPVKAAEPVKSADAPKSDASKPAAKDDAAARLDALRQEFSATQAKLQREVAQLTMQVKEAQALKEAVEKGLNAQVGSLQQELAAAKGAGAKAGEKELEALKKEMEALKAKHQKELDTAREVAKAEMIAQAAILQKEIEAAKAAGGSQSFKAQGEELLRSMFHRAWQDGIITDDEKALLMVLKGAIEMTEEKFGTLQEGTKNDAYLNALRSVWSDGVVTPDESDFLTALREKLGIPADEHFKLEGLIRKELKK